MSNIGILGRTITLTVGGQTLLGVITKEFTLGNTEQDVTDDQSSGWRELTAVSGVKGIDLSVSGPIKNFELVDTYFQASNMVNCAVTLPDGSTLSFDAFIQEITFGGDANERNEFSTNLLSSGQPTWTPAA